MESYDEARFKANVDAAMVRIRTILENTRNPQLPAQIPHQYEDKYTLAEFLTRTTIAAILQCLGGLGLSEDGLKQLSAWARNHSVTLRFKARDSCTFSREETRQVESAQQLVVEKRSFFGGTETTTGKVVTKIQEFFWTFEFKYELVAFQGVDEANGITILSRMGKVELKTATKKTPQSEKTIRSPLDVDITWLLQQIDGAHRASFSIDRIDSACRTPRRNPPIQRAFLFVEALSAWCSSIESYFFHGLFPVQPDHGRDLSVFHAREIFVPVLPLLERSPNGKIGEQTISLAGPFLAEQQRSLAARCAQLSQIFPRDASILTVTDAVLVVTLLHAVEICQHFCDGVDYIEDQLYEQLRAAVGKELSTEDFRSYMEFHYKKLFSPSFRPQPFSQAVRRPNHDPEGAVSVEMSRNSSNKSAPIFTTCAKSEAQSPMTFAINASTKISFFGERHLHAWVSYEFTGQRDFSLDLIARARQFSSFILLAGRITSVDSFEPKLGILVQNKDLLKIPLILETIPTPKEFRDAIESLSPEQQRFAKAFRSMQLESTLFGVCILQVKPQLEALLNLPPDSLTKEIKLAQDLLTLFSEFQIPSDLVSYDGLEDASKDHKITTVSGHVQKMMAMISQSKAQELAEAREREQFRLAEAGMTDYDEMPLPSMVASPRPTGAPMQPPAPMLAMPMPAPAPGSAGAMPVGGGGRPPAPKRAPKFMARASAAVPAAAPVPAPMLTQSGLLPTTSTTMGDPMKKTSASVDSSTHSQSTTSSSQKEKGVKNDLFPPMDYTRIPAELDKKFEEIDEDASLRPTILHPGGVWNRTSQKSLLSEPEKETLHPSDQERERNKAFDLLDALTKSGAIPIHHASLHVLIASTHRFDKMLIDTVIQQNVNPIEKAERSEMIIATTIHERPAAELLMPDQQERFLGGNPRLGRAPSLLLQEDPSKKDS